MPAEPCILHVLQPTYGGVPAYVLSLVPYIEAAGYRQVIICPEKTVGMDAVKSTAVTVRPLPMVRQISPAADFTAMLRLRRQIQEIRPDIIYLHSSKAGALGRLAAAGTGIPVCCNPHGWAFIMDGSRLKKSIYGCIERALAPLAAALIVVSEAERQAALLRHISKRRLVLISSGIDVQRFSAAKRPEILTDRFVVGFSGRLSAAKDPLKVLDIINQLIDDIPEVTGLLVGDGELREEVEQRIVELGLQERIIITGWSETPEEYMARFDVGVLPSRWEAFGLAVCEYMAAGVPAVVSAAGGFRDIISSGEDGFIVESGDTAEYCRTILKLYRSPELRAAVTAAARETVKDRFSAASTAARHLELFAALQRGRSHG
jgi:glycosyltransferase involved in cell wall biosynthesis